MIGGFRELAVKGDMMNLTVGMIITAAFGKIVDSPVADMIMPVVGRIFGGVNFSDYLLPLSGQTATTLVEAGKAAPPVAVVTPEVSR